MANKFVVGLVQVLLCSGILLAQASDSEPRVFEFGSGMKITGATAGLLGDMTNMSPGFGLYFDFAKHVKNGRMALRGRISTDAWGSHEFRKTEGHRVEVSRIAVTVGPMFFFGYNKGADSWSYICLEAGTSRWCIDSSTYPPLNHYWCDRPTAGIQFGKAYEGLRFELGVEANVMNTDNIAFKDYGKLNYAINASFAYTIRTTSSSKR
jgi:hypothetical protein